MVTTSSRPPNVIFLRYQVRVLYQRTDVHVNRGWSPARVRKCGLGLLSEWLAPRAH
jgi:hypothetical protein